MARKHKTLKLSAIALVALALAVLPWLIPSISIVTSVIGWAVAIVFVLTAVFVSGDSSLINFMDGFDSGGSSTTTANNSSMSNSFKKIGNIFFTIIMTLLCITFIGLAFYGNANNRANNHSALVRNIPHGVNYHRRRSADLPPTYQSAISSHSEQLLPDSKEAPPAYNPSDSNPPSYNEAFRNDFIDPAPDFIDPPPAYRN